LALLMAAAVSAAAQSRDDVRVYIPLVVAVDPMQADFFQKNFSMELAGAGYTVTQNVTEADFSLRLRVRENMVIYADGSTEQAPPGEDQYILQINLMRNSDNSQVVQLSYGFSELEEMYDHNLSLIYQVMANVPLSRSDGDKTLVKFMVGRGEEREDWWRNKWLYFRMSADYPISYHQIKTDNLYEEKYLYDEVENDDGTTTIRYSRIEDKVLAMPGATVGLELQFLNWMSIEANFEARFWDIGGFAFSAGIGAQLKFPIKPADHFMLEPYGAFVYGMNFADHSILFPRYAVGGGMQFGVKGGKSTVLFFDVNYMHSLDDVKVRNLDDHFTQPEALSWKRFIVGVSMGFKAGAVDRRKRIEENTTWLFNNN